MRVVNEFDRDGHRFKIGANTDGQVSIYIDDKTKTHHGYHFLDVTQIPKGFELDGKLMLQLPTNCDAAVDRGIQELRQK